MIAYLLSARVKKLSPTTFKEICKNYRLSNANIEICGEECGSDPLSVVNFAIKRYNKDRQKGKLYNRVYCVIDRDKHNTFAAAIDKLRNTKRGKGVIFDAIVSVPCFEFWLLLHFGCTDRQFIAQGKASNCAIVVSELDKPGKVPGYRKGAKNIFALTKDKLNDAIKHAKRLGQSNKDTDSVNPATNMHELIEFLTNLNNRQG